MFVTAWIGVLTISTGELDFVNAGHCRPFLFYKDGTGTYETEGKGLILAGMEGVSYRQFHTQLKAGEGIFLYTDGVTEATDEHQILYGEERLEQTLCPAGAVLSISEPQKLLAHVWNDVDRFQKGNQFDDITMLALFYQGSGLWQQTFSLSGKTQNMEDAADDLTAFSRFLEKTLKASGMSRKSVQKISMAADEVYSNICFYSTASKVTVIAEIERISEDGHKNFRIRFEDNGFPYNPLERPDPELSREVKERKIGGLGIYLAKKRMDKVNYEYVDGKNCLTMEKRDEEDID